MYIIGVMVDAVFHKFLRLPYRLNVHVDQRGVRPRATVVLLHGIGDSAASWDQIVAVLPRTVRVISVDLLGFGRSPAPQWLKYSVRVQARSVVRTLLGRRIRHPLIIVGHSMGSLVAVEIARRYPLLVRSLILCSPPIYSDEQRRRLLPNPNRLLRMAYRLLVNHPEQVVKLSALVARIKIAGAAFDIRADNVEVFMSALESSIINQTTLDDIIVLKKPIHMIHGNRDPLVIKANLKAVAEANYNATLSVIKASHELGGAYVPAIAAAVDQAM